MINRYSILSGEKYFSLNGLENYLVFRVFINYFLSKDNKFYSWTSKRISEESITHPSKTEEIFYPEII